ncbi:hypothetical protein ACFU6I_27160 [Streptomyces sp. NPDC057486]|uniref:hypothetical protein n=1 Tax=Streptomyces sp. NPDC057486 TaxID=3346145 RepID=UPI0036921AB3
MNAPAQDGTATTGITVKVADLGEVAFEEDCAPAWQGWAHQEDAAFWVGTTMGALLSGAASPGPSRTRG